ARACVSVVTGEGAIAVARFTAVDDVVSAAGRTIAVGGGGAGRGTATVHGAARRHAVMGADGGAFCCGALERVARACVSIVTGGGAHAEAGGDGRITTLAHVEHAVAA